MRYFFHENMVVWKKEDAWNGLGFFGESRRGKTPLSLAFARLLFANGRTAIKVFDDCLELEDGRVSQCRCWGSRDEFGENYYQELKDVMRSRGSSIEEVDPRSESFILGNAAVWLLLTSEPAKSFVRETVPRRKFIEEFMKTNPFIWNNTQPSVQAISEKLKESWVYSLVFRGKTTTKELIDALARAAFALSTRLGMG